MYNGAFDPMVIQDYLRRELMNGSNVNPWTKTHDKPYDTPEEK